MNEDISKELVMELRIAANLSEGERKNFLREKTKEFLGYNDSELVDARVLLIKTLSSFDDNTKLVMFKSAIETLCDDFNEDEACRLIKAHLSAMTKLPNELKESEARDTETYVLELDREYQRKFIKLLRESFEELPSNLKEDLQRMFSPNFINMLNQ